MRARNKTAKLDVFLLYEDFELGGNGLQSIHRTKEGALKEQQRITRYRERYFPALDATYRIKKMRVH